MTEPGRRRGSDLRIRAFLPGPLNLRGDTREEVGAAASYRTQREEEGSDAAGNGLFCPLPVISCGDAREEEGAAAQSGNPREEEGFPKICSAVVGGLVGDRAKL